MHAHVFAGTGLPLANLRTSVVSLIALRHGCHAFPLAYLPLVVALLLRRLIAFRVWLGTARACYVRDERGLDVLAVMYHHAVDDIDPVDGVKVIRMTKERFDIDLDHLVSLYAAGNSQLDCARILGVPPSAVRHRLVKAGVELPTHKPIDYNRIVSMYESGMSCEAIAPHFNVSGTTIRRRLIASGVALRQGPSYRKPDTMLTKRMRAVTREAEGLHVGPHETHFAGLLDDMGVRYGQQTVFGRYNVDFALKELPVVIEIQAGGGSKRAVADYFNRTKYLLDSGQHVIAVKINSGYGKTITRECAENVIACAHRLCGNPSTPSQYRVFRGDGHMVALRGANRDRWASIGALAGSYCTGESVEALRAA